MPWVRKRLSYRVETAAIIALVFGFVIFTAFAGAVLFISVSTQTDSTASSLR